MSAGDVVMATALCVANVIVGSPTYCLKVLYYSTIDEVEFHLTRGFIFIIFVIVCFVDWVQ